MAHLILFTFTFISSILSSYSNYLSKSKPFLFNTHQKLFYCPCLFNTLSYIYSQFFSKYLLFTTIFTSKPIKNNNLVKLKSNICFEIKFKHDD